MFFFFSFLGNLSSLECFLVEYEKYLVFGFAHQASLCLQKEVLVRVGVKKVQEKHVTTNNMWMDKIALLSYPPKNTNVSAFESK